MPRDTDRVKSIENALEEAGLNALICTLPSNVLLISGYWPVVGASLALITEEGYVSIVAPEDEREFAEQGWADDLSLVRPGSLSEIKSLVQSMRGRVAEIGSILPKGARVGFEEAMFDPAAYAAQYIFNGAMRELVSQAMPSIHLKPAGQVLGRLRAILTPQEIRRLRTACQIAETAFSEGLTELRAGLTEAEAASHFRVPLSTRGTTWEGVSRADGYTFCMSGANSSKAYASFQRSTGRELQPGDFALLHCNSYADGFWTDITRTYCLGEPDERQHAIYDAVLSARQVALEMIKPEVSASEVDQAARSIVAERGFGEQFKHPLGHGVGFAAIDHWAQPCLHPASKDILEVGMAFNIEPAVYFEGYGGVRHCDTVVVTPEGVEVLTPFQSRLADLAVTLEEVPT